MSLQHAFGWRFEDKSLSLYLFRNTSVSGRRNERKEHNTRSRTGHTWQEHVSVSNILGVSEMTEIIERQKKIRLDTRHIFATTKDREEREWH